MQENQTDTNRQERIDAIYQALEEIRPESDFRNSTDFFGEYLLDSFDLFALISVLEERFGVSIDLNDIEPSHFSSIEEIEKLLARSAAV